MRIPLPAVSAETGLVSMETSWAMPMLSYGRCPPPVIMSVSIPSTWEEFWAWLFPRVVM
ncbi:MAG: hypothetical protein OXH04_08185 [Acidobacteria bacterium]|nr:hypothetical protein [Acidobacteriota bacterium]